MVKKLIVTKDNPLGILKKIEAKKLGFKLCTNFAGLLESL